MSADVAEVISSKFKKISPCEHLFFPRLPMQDVFYCASRLGLGFEMFVEWPRPGIREGISSL